MSAYEHKAVEYAHVMLPIGPFTETAGTFINMEGRVQSFNGCVQPLGETRPAWKVLRVLANLLGHRWFRPGHRGSRERGSARRQRGFAASSTIASTRASLGASSARAGGTATHRRSADLFDRPDRPALSAAAENAGCGAAGRMGERRDVRTARACGPTISCACGRAMARPSSQSLSMSAFPTVASGWLPRVRRPRNWARCSASSAPSVSRPSRRWPSSHGIPDDARAVLRSDMAGRVDPGENRSDRRCRSCSRSPTSRCGNAR